MSSQPISEGEGKRVVDISVNKLKQNPPSIVNENRATEYIRLLRLQVSTSNAPLDRIFPFPEALKGIQRSRFCKQLKSQNPETLTNLASTVTRVCSQLNIAYNNLFLDLASPFLYSGMSEKDAFLCLIAFIRLYSPFVAVTAVQGGSHEDAETNSMNSIGAIAHSLFKLIILGLRYHDPVLEGHIRRMNIDLEQIISRWFLKVFTPLLSFDLFLIFMDNYLQHSEPTFFYFIVLSILISLRNEVLLLLGDKILDTLEGYKIESMKSLRNITKKAKELSLNTPSSLKKQILSAMNNTLHFKNWVYLYSLSAPCIHLSIVDLFDDMKRRNFNYLIIDCRSKAEFDAGTLSGAIHCDPVNFSTLEGLAMVQKEIQHVASSHVESSRVLHIAVVGVGGHSAEDIGARERSILMNSLAENDLLYLSVVRNGFIGCHEHFEKNEIMLENHDEKTCQVCLNKNKGANAFSSFFTKTTNFFSSLSTSLKSRMTAGENNEKNIPNVNRLLFGDEKHYEDTVEQKESPEIEEKQQVVQENKSDVEYSIDFLSILSKYEPKEWNVKKPQTTEEKTSEESDIFSNWSQTAFRDWKATKLRIQQCFFIDEKAEEHKRYLVFHPEYLFCLQPIHNEAEGESEESVEIICKHSYSALHSLVLQKSKPKFVKMRFRTNSKDVLFEECFSVEGMRDFIKALRKQVEMFASE